ncbi:craniofacial development protein 2-like [Hetaerina americana]|uniref:craniofacial development protein 2-like n=1 Tax=Hetaerina americana TaxID=62018 RepID=UPI003A7F493E
MEMDRLGINILGVREIKRAGADDFWSDGYRVIYSGYEQRIAGVSIILKKEWARRVKSCWQYSERILMIRLEGRVCMQMSSHSEKEIEEVYEQLEEVIGAAKGKENLIVMGERNTVVVEGRAGRSVGQFGLGKRNPAGESLIEFCYERNMVVANTIFEQHPRGIYTWKMPGDKVRYLIGYILVRTRCKNKVSKCKSYPSADTQVNVNRNHNLVIMDTGLR